MSLMRMIQSAGLWAINFYLLLGVFILILVLLLRVEGIYLALDDMSEEGLSVSFEILGQEG